MINSFSPINQDSSSFKLWLKKNFNLSERASSNYVSRCRRVERELNISLKDYLHNKNSYMELMETIKKHSKEKTKTSSSQYALTATLRGAVKKYALFCFPKNAEIYNIGNYSKK